MRSRRNLLAASCAGLLSSTGCVGTLRTSSSGSDGSDVAVEDVGVRKAIVYESMSTGDGHDRILAEEGRQYVVAAVRGNVARSSSDFALTADGRAWKPGLTGTGGGTNWAVAGREGGPVGDPIDDDRAFLAFEVPSPLSASTPRIRLSDGDAEWLLSDDARERLASSGPRFELDALEVPDAVSYGDPLAVSLTVTNVSETDGRFLAAIRWPTTAADDDEFHVVERSDVAAGDAATTATEIETEYTVDEAGPVTLRVSGHVTADREVQVRDVPTSV